MGIFTQDALEAVVSNLKEGKVLIGGQPLYRTIKSPDTTPYVVFHPAVFYVPSLMAMVHLYSHGLCDGMSRVEILTIEGYKIESKLLDVFRLWGYVIPNHVRLQVISQFEYSPRLVNGWIIIATVNGYADHLVGMIPIMPSSEVTRLDLFTTFGT